MESNELRIESGGVLVYRAFDVAEEINLSAVEKLAAGKIPNERLQIKKMQRPALILRDPPLSFNIRPETLNLCGANYNCELGVKFFDYGTLSLCYHIPISSGTDWASLNQLALAIENSEEIDGSARRHASELSELFKGALKDPKVWPSFEDYSIYFLQKLSCTQNPLELLRAQDIVSLLSAEPGAKHSEAFREATLTEKFQYREEDLAVIDWNSALVVEPSGSKEIPDIIEFALTQLLEVRFYDDLIDKRLSALYDEMELVRKSLTSNRFLKASEEASALYIEFSELVEKVDNSLKVVGDFYLAKIFRAASRRFRISDWEESITRKMNILAQVSDLLQGEVNTRRSHWMELVIIALIAFEIFSAFFKS